jgi:hypothetical protein
VCAATIAAAPNSSAQHDADDEPPAAAADDDPDGASDRPQPAQPDPAPTAQSDEPAPADAAPAPSAEAPDAPPAPRAGADPSDADLDASDLAGIDGLDPEDRQALQEVTPSELGALDPAAGLSPRAEAELEAQAEALEGLSPADLDKVAALYKDVLREKLRQVRDQTHERTVEKIRAKNDARIGTVATVLGCFSLAGLSLLLMPLRLGKRFPGQAGRLLGYAAIAAATFVVSILLFTGVLVGMNAVRGALAEESHPQIVLQDATFEAADEHIDDLAAMPGLLMVPLESVSEGEQESLAAAMLDNAASFKEDLDALRTVAGAYRSVQGLLGWVGPALTLLAVVLFLVNLRGLLGDILRFPERAMRGEISAAAAVSQAGKRVGGEMVATLATVGVLVVLTVLTSVATSVVAGPGMSMFVEQLIATLQYVFVDAAPSKAYVYVGLGSILAFIVLALATIVLGSAIYVGKVQKVFRARFCDGVPLGAHKAFFGWRSLGMLWILALPLVTLLGTSLVAGSLVDKGTSGDGFDWFTALVPGPLALVIGFVLLFSVALGLKSLLAIARYKVEVPAPPQGGRAVDAFAATQRAA